MRERFDLATVFLALSLFFGGLTTVFRRRLPRSAPLTVGVVGLVVGTGAVVRAHLA